MLFSGFFKILRRKARATSAGPTQDVELTVTNDGELAQSHKLCNAAERKSPSLVSEELENPEYTHDKESSVIQDNYESIEFGLTDAGKCLKGESKEPTVEVIELIENPAYDLKSDYELAVGSL